MLIWQLILIQAITALGIFIFLRLLFSRDLSAALKRLQELQRQNIEKEIALNKEFELAKQERQAEIEKGRDEAKKLKDLARQEAEKAKEQALLKAKQEAETLLAHAAQERELLKHQLSQQIEETSVNLALGMIRDIFSQEARQELQRELVDELITELRKIEKEKLKVETKKALVVSSYPLLDNQKNAVRTILQDTLGCPIELEEKTDTAIISGLIINLGGLILDGSLQNKLRKIIPSIKK
jgi:F0F1-type ATP synthase delta subunit